MNTKVQHRQIAFGTLVNLADKKSKNPPVQYQFSNGREFKYHDRNSKLYNPS